MKALLAYVCFIGSGIIAERLDTMLSRRRKSLHPALYWLLGAVGMFLFFVLGEYSP